MARDRGPHTSRAHPYVPQQPSPARPTHRPSVSSRTAMPSSVRHDLLPPHFGPVPQAREALPPQPDLRPQAPVRPQFRLRPGHDDALIRWLGSLSPRQRSRAIRTALCRYLAEQSDRRPAEWREDPDLAHALDSLF